MAEALKDDLPPMGHNAVSALPTVDKIISDLEFDNAAQLARVDALVEKGKEFFIIENDDQDAAATEFMVKLRARYKFSEADRVAAKTPFDDLAGAVQAFFKTRILDKLGLSPTNTKEEFDPQTAEMYGVGPRIGMAMTLYKRRKAEKERLTREALAEAARKVEADAKAMRDAAAAEAKRIADAAAAEAKAKADKKAADRKAIADKAAADAKALADAAARKRTADNKATADAAAKAAADLAAKLKADQEEADRKAAADLAEQNRIAAQKLDEQNKANLAEENRIAMERSKLEDAASATTADLSRARGGKGGVSSLREFVDFRDVKRDLLGEIEGEPLHDVATIVTLLPYIPDAALDKAIKDYAKANKATVETGIKTGKQPLRGVIFFMNSKSAGRA